MLHAMLFKCKLKTLEYELESRQSYEMLLYKPVVLKVAQRLTFFGTSCAFLLSSISAGKVASLTM